jgi:hypothetical protein
MGCDDELTTAEPLPDFVEGVEILDRMSAASLVQVKPRYILYREICVPADSESCVDYAAERERGGDKPPMCWRPP